MDYSSSGARRGFRTGDMKSCRCVWWNSEAGRFFRLRSLWLIEFLRGGSNYFFCVCECTDGAAGSCLASFLRLCYLSCKNRVAAFQQHLHLYRGLKHKHPKLCSSVSYSWKESLHLDFPSLPCGYLSLILYFSSTFCCSSTRKGEQIEP